MEQKLPITFFSQFDPSVPTEDQNNICGIACLKMIIDYKLGKKIDIKELLRERDRLEVKVPGVGSSHAGLSMILRNYGISSYAQEFKSSEGVYAERLTIDGLDKMKRAVLSGKPVIVSIVKPELNSTHLVLLIGYNDEFWIFADPYNKDGEPLSLSDTSFQEVFRKMVVFTE